MYVGGEFTLAADGGTRELFNPASGELVAIVAEGAPSTTPSARLRPRAKPSTTARGRKTTAADRAMALAL